MLLALKNSKDTRHCWKCAAGNGQSVVGNLFRTEVPHQQNHRAIPMLKNPTFAPHN